MEEIDKVLQALSVVERYEEYLFRKTWGRVLIVIGVVLPLGVLINMNAAILASTIGLDVGLVSLIANVLIILLCWGFVAYTFTALDRTVRKRIERASTDSKHGPLIGIVWFVSFLLTGIFPESLRLVSILWAASASCILSFVILRVVGSHGQDRVLLYLGICLGLSSFPLLLISDAILLGYAALIAFSTCFILAGFVTSRMAAGMLQQAS